MDMREIPILVLLAALALAIVVASSHLWRRLRLRRAFFALYEQISWSIKRAPRNKFVLEVGSGHNPHIRSDVLCEKYLYDDSHRAAGVIADRPLVVGDALALPFKTGIFDVIISRQMIEHLEDPQSFFDEAARVAHSGLFNAPSAIKERLISSPAHLWLIEQKGNSLYFTAKTEPIYDSAIQEFFGQAVMKDINGFDDFSLDHWGSLEIAYDWEKQPRCVINDPTNSSFIQASTVYPTVTRTLTGIERVRDKMRCYVRSGLHSLLSSRSRRQISWSQILACPRCHRNVSFLESQIVCHNCMLSFPIDRGIPIMLLDCATPFNGGSRSRDQGMVQID